MSRLKTEPRAEAAVRRRSSIGTIDRFHLPVGDRPIVGYFLDHLFAAHGRRERWARLLARRLPSALGIRLVSPPRWAVKLRAGRSFALDRRQEKGGIPPELRAAPPRGSENPRLQERLQRFSTALQYLSNGSPGARALAGSAERWILLDDYPTSARERLVAFLFEHEESSPWGVLKVGPPSDSGRPMRREWEALRAVTGRLPATIRRTVPEPLAYGIDAASSEVLLLRAVPGRSAYVEARNALRPRRLIARHFRAAALWLARFQSVGWSSSRRAFPVEAEREAVAQILGLLPSAPDLRWFDELCGLCRQFPITLSMAHGDFWSRNLILPRSETGMPAVVDWESFEPEVPVFVDLFHFPLTYGLVHRWPRLSSCPPEEAFRLTFLESNAVSREVRAYLRIYCRETGMPPQMLKPLLQLYLLTRLPPIGAGSTAGERRAKDRSVDLFRSLAGAEDGILLQ